MFSGRLRRLNEEHWCTDHLTSTEMKYKDAGSTFHSENTCKFIFSAQIGDRHLFILENRGINIVKMDESHYKKENGEDGSIKFPEM